MAQRVDSGVNVQNPYAASGNKVPAPSPHAPINMSAKSAAQPNTSELSVVKDRGSASQGKRRKADSEELSVIIRKRPCFLRGFLWMEHSTALLPPSAAATELAEPCPSPPENELHNATSLRTLGTHSDLFAIITPINVLALAHVLANHPNRQFVDSLLVVLCEGFWPYAQTDGLVIPSVVKHPNRAMTDVDTAFVRTQRDEEVRLLRFSLAFPALLPGMQTSPLGVVPKPHSTKMRLVVDESARDFSLNSYITSEDAHIQLDGIHKLAKSLLRFHSQHGRGPRYLFKTDVSQAY